jgi:surfeit locus 1 family protein
MLADSALISAMTKPPRPGRPLRRLILPGLMTAAMLAVLISLGVWQVHRLAWKEGILARLARAESGPAAPMPAEGVPSPYSKVAVSGRFRPDLSALYGAEVRQTPDGVAMGAQLLMPLERPGGATLLVDRGWVPLSRKRPIDTPKGEVTVDGYIDPAARPGPFSARDDVAGRQFFTLDPAVIGAALGLLHIEPFTLVVLGGRPTDLYPDPARHLPQPPNNHLSYAITWFGLALALAVIFGVWSAKALHP